MDYEKKYKEALEIAKSLYKEADEPIRKIYEGIFPELAESEDEKIRKGLLSYFKKTHIGTFNGIDAKGIIAWLEKQKPSDKEQTNKNLQDNGFRRMFEQKPVEWSEKDREMRKRVLDFLSVSSRCNVNDYETIEEWLNSIKDRCLPQPNGEWSEEDEKHRKRIIELLYCANSTLLPVTNEDIDWLKSLRPQKQWKPNGDQIDALYDMIRSFKKESSYSNRDDIANIVEALLEQLKAL